MGEKLREELPVCVYTDRCPQYWGVHTKRCLLYRGHEGECIFPLSARDVRAFADSDED